MWAQWKAVAPRKRMVIGVSAGWLSLIFVLHCTAGISASPLCLNADADVRAFFLFFWFCSCCFASGVWDAVCRCWDAVF